MKNVLILSMSSRRLLAYCPGIPLANVCVGVNKVIIYSFHERGVNTEILCVNCNRKNGRNVCISQSVSLSTHPLHIFSLCRPVFLLDIGKHVRDSLQPSFPREAIGSRIERRASGFGMKGDGVATEGEGTCNK